MERADRKVYEPDIKTKSWEKEAQSSEILFKRNFKSLDDAWKAGYKLLIQSVEHHMTQKQPNLKLYGDSIHSNQTGDRL